MECDVCGHEMQRQPIPPSQQSSEVWSCPWCHADTRLGGEHFEIARPPYTEIEDRWVRAYSYELFDDVGHAYAGQNQTLCGIRHSDISGTPWPWHHPRGNPCPDCFSTAVVIDARWPTNKRGHSDRHSVRAERGPTSPPNKPTQDWSTAADDQLGRPDLVLEFDGNDPYVRLQATEDSTAAADTTTFPASWYGTHLGVYRPWTWTSTGEYPMAQLPMLDTHAFTGDFSWMGGIGDSISLRIVQIEVIKAELKHAGLTLPADFEALATRTNPHTALDRSGSFMELTGPLINPAEPEARMIRFFREQAKRWFLYLRPNDQSFIVSSHEPFQTYEPGDEVKQREDGSPGNTIAWCAPSAEVFAYRFHTEMTIARAISEGQRAEDLPPGARAYLAAALRCRPL